MLIFVALFLSASAVDDDERMPLELRGAFGQGVRLSDADDNFAVDASARLQLRSVTAFDVPAEPESPGAQAGDPFAQDFLVRRARITLGGHLLRGDVSWRLQIGVSRFDVEADLPIILRDAFINWRAPGNVNLRAGQMKVPFDRQRLTSSGALQFPDRARAVNELNLDRDIGVQIFHDEILPDGALSLHGGVFGGDGRNRPIASSGLLYVARAQLAPLGDFDDLSEGDLTRDPKPRVATAIAVAFNDSTHRTRSTVGDVLESDDTISYLHGTADVLLKWHGISVLSEVLLRAALDDRGDDRDARSGAGALLQVGAMLTDHVEVAARVSRLAPLNVSWKGAPPNDAALVLEHEAALATNLYFVEHDFKLQIEAAVVDTPRDESGFRDVDARVTAQLQLQL